MKKYVILFIRAICMYDVSVIYPHIIAFFLTVADMCTSSFATEETVSGGSQVDSVVLRIMTQQDNCICRVTISNQILPVYIGLRKYGGLSSLAPVEYG